ncbi:hypothetical protein E2C01_093258 [Portunus trituberculatus]|uniref:Uncharacterized protein n=1 Tax=Portunus trituberculatus TaxID=210409 RepID=A0A5B7K011_PORTR|nr:hypothetical protein [Portunus trituberculatus]
MIPWDLIKGGMRHHISEHMIICRPVSENTYFVLRLTLSYLSTQLTWEEM